MLAILPLVGSLACSKYMLLYFLSSDSVQYNFSVYKLCNLSVFMDVIHAIFDFELVRLLTVSMSALHLILAKNCPLRQEEAKYSFVILNVDFGG